MKIVMCDSCCCSYDTGLSCECDELDLDNLEILPPELTRDSFDDEFADSLFIPTPEEA